MPARYPIVPDNAHTPWIPKNTRDPGGSYLCPSLEIFLPAFVGDGSFFILPGLQALEGEPIPLCECLSVQTGLASPGLDAASLSIFTESIELVLKVRCRDSEKSSQPWQLVDNPGKIADVAANPVQTVDRDGTKFVLTHNLHHSL